MRKKGNIEIRQKSNDKMRKKATIEKLPKRAMKRQQKRKVAELFTSLLLIVPPRWSGSPKIADGRQS